MAYFAKGFYQFVWGCTADSLSMRVLRLLGVSTVGSLQKSLTWMIGLSNVRIDVQVDALSAGIANSQVNLFS